jgi:dTDP-4-dehydrorhamnose reductase
MLRLGKERESLGVIFDQTGTPTFAGDLARTMLTILEKMHPETAYRETYHFSNEGVCSWYDFAVAVMRQKKLPCKIRPIETAEFPVKAKRPPYSVLNKAKIKKEWQIDIPHWQDSLTKVLGTL